MSKISKIIARQIFDSRGNPTIETEVFVKDISASAICPSGASTETYEAFEKRDINNKKYLNKHCEVLIENKLGNQEEYFGRTKYMTPVIFKANNCKVGELANIKITSFNQKNLFGIYESNKVKAA